MSKVNQKLEGEKLIVYTERDFKLTSPASQDRFPVKDTIEYVEIAILQSKDDEIKQKGG